MIIKWSEPGTVVRFSYQRESWRTMECLLSISGSSCLPCHHHASVQLVPKYIKSESESHHYQFIVPKVLSIINNWVLLPPLSPPSFSSVQLVPKYRSKVNVYHRHSQRLYSQHQRISRTQDSADYLESLEGFEALTIEIGWSPPLVMMIKAIKKWCNNLTRFLKHSGKLYFYLVTNDIYICAELAMKKRMIIFVEFFHK